MSHTPYGYKIENAKAVIDEVEAERLNKLYLGYLNGLSIKDASINAGIKCYHSTAGKMLQNKTYLGDNFYPQIIDKETFEKVISERNIRAIKLNKTKKQIKEPICGYVPTFKSPKVEHKFDNPFMQAEYAYSLIESEV